MWIEEAEELFKGYFLYYLLVVLPVFIIISPVNPVSAAYEFPVYRMQHFDLYDVPYGCRSASVNLEARSLLNWSTSRHCVVTKVNDLTIDHFHNIRTKAGALVVILPEDFLTISPEEKQHLMALENVMLAQEVLIPVYFVTWTAEVEKILGEISHKISTEDKGKSAAETLINSVAANGYQIFINPRSPSAKQDIHLTTLQGSLPARTYNGRVPAVVVVAHYDSFGVAPELSIGTDSNGSGVAMLLELMRLFSLLYSDPKTHGEFNLVFILSSGGKLNYIGSARWLDERTEFINANVAQNISFVMCLDTLAASDDIYMHVSIPPKDYEKNAVLFYKNLKSAAERHSVGNCDGIHKKINLGAKLLAWEHEIYNIRRNFLYAFTISSLKSHKDLRRGTVADTSDSFNLDRLVQNTQLVAEALASTIYNVSGSELFRGTLQVDRSHLEAWMKFLSSQPRSAQLLCNKDNMLINFLKESFNKYLRDVYVSYVTPGPKESYSSPKGKDFMLYDVTKSTAYFYSVKPAVFDLILTLIIVVYLGAVYLVVQKFPSLYRIGCNVTSKSKAL